MVTRGIACAWLCACSFSHGSAPASSLSDSGGSAHEYLDAPAKMIDAPADAATGALMVTASVQAPGEIILSNEGTIDWAHWGLNNVGSFDHRSGGTSISDATASGPASAVVGAAVTSSWTGGTPDGSATRSDTGIAVGAPDKFSFTIAADTTMHTAHLYVSGHAAKGKVSIALSDNSAMPYTNDQFVSGGDWYGRYTIMFKAASPGQTLNLTWADEQDFQLSAWTTLLSVTVF